MKPNHCYIIASNISILTTHFIISVYSVFQLMNIMLTKVAAEMLLMMLFHRFSQNILQQVFDVALTMGHPAIPHLASYVQGMM